ncbi:hypothetical protein [Kordia jejudonensis]|uniref:hypothetical protein n=1 Tax=Kordia jejudonensis TaxID=1348245 RepID=UPI0006295A96|nr:hypothetical protein [Kordia jejudonensis]
MKKKKLNSLRLNKQRISQLHDKKGGAPGPIDVGQTLNACLTEFCAIISVLVCPPPQTQFCTVECVTLNCTFVNC